MREYLIFLGNEELSASLKVLVYNSSAAELVRACVNHYSPTSIRGLLSSAIYCTLIYQRSWALSTSSFLPQRRSSYSSNQTYQVDE